MKRYRAASAGSAAHTHTTAGHTLTIAEIPSHKHMNSVNYKAFSSGSSGWAFVTNDTPGLTNSSSLWGLSENTGGGGSHTHGNTGSTTPGATGSASNLPPYIVAYIWRRTA